MKIMVTGHRGYIGAHLVELLKWHGHTVIGVDVGLFNDCAWETVTPPDIEWERDVRSLEAKDFDGVDCVMHLAAISNDPMGDLDAEVTYSINHRGSVHVAKAAKAAGVARFLFASSCSMYGKGESLDLTEDSSLNPITAYAESKINAERDISALADADFCPAYLRNSTAYGHSPMFRIDLVVNNLLACALAKGDIKIKSDGEPWRPLIHCRDIARAFIAFMEAPRANIFDKGINVGGNAENYQVKDVARKVQELVPNADIVFTGEVGEDPRNYRVNFDLLATAIPGFQLSYTLAQGMEELLRRMSDHRFTADDFDGDQFVRLRAIKKTLDRLAD